MRLYRVLLHLYPASFRAEYGDQMCAIVEGRPRAWAGVFFEVLWNAAAVHLDLLRQDLRYALRTFARAPGFTLAVVLVAGLGIGANIAVFTVTDHALIRPLPFPDSQRLVALWGSQPGYSRTEVSPPNFRDWKIMSTSFETMAAWRNISVNLVGLGEPERLEGASVTADLFSALGARPALGRVFGPEDDRDGAPAMLLLSHRVWLAKFGGDPAVLGRRVLLDNARYIVIGVMPPEFQFPTRKTGIWTAMRFTGADMADRKNWFLYVVARMKPGVSLQQAREEMRVIAARLERAYPNDNERTSATVNHLRDEIASRTKLLVAALFGAALCLLLITCTNLANLLMARSVARRHELAVRASLGAGRERLVRQLVTESLALAALGGALGVLAARAAVPLLTRLAPTTLPVPEPAIDFRVMVFALLLTGLTGLAFGAIPALRSRGAALRDGTRTTGGNNERFRSSLVLVEVTLSVVLLISAGLLVRALWRLEGIDPGFQADGVLTLRTVLPMPKYESTARRVQFYDRVISAVRQLPGVSHAAYISFVPMTMRGGIWEVKIGGRTRSRSENHTASLRFVTPGFFEALRIPVRRGRDVGESDTRDAQFVAVVSESFARRYWPGEDPIGRRFEFAFNERTIVGVVGDIRVRGLERTSEPQVYLPYGQVRDGALVSYPPKDLVVRSSSVAVLPAIRRIIREADPEQPISDVQTLEEIVAADSAPRRAQVRVLGAFAAVLLASLGIHALLSFTVSQRAQEIGVRMALGAQRGHILAMVLRQSLVPAAAGVVAGVALGYAAGRAIESLLLGVAPADPVTFIAAAALSLAMAGFGSVLPALRAVRVDPTSVMRAT